MFRNFLKTTFRAFRRSSGFGVLNIVGLALGIACAGLIFMWVEDELSFDHLYPKHDNLFSIRMNLDYAGKIESNTVVPGPMPEAIRGTIPDIVNVMRMSWSRDLFGLDDKATYERGCFVDSSFFSMFQPAFVQGNASGFTNPHSLVLSEKMANKFFGSANPLGKTLRINRQQDFVVIGVVKDQPSNVSIQFDWLAPVSNWVHRYPWLNSWSTYGINTLVELRPGANLAQVNRQLTALLQPRDQLYAHATCMLYAMNDWRLYDNFTNGQQNGGRITQVRLFSVIAWIILVIACINFMNLSTARAGQRAREIGVRKTLGALRKTLIRQFLAETLVMAFIALLLAVGLIAVFLGGFNDLVGKQLVFNPLTPMHLVGLLSIGGFCGLIAGSYPAFYLSSFRPVEVLKGQKVNLRKGAGYIRKGLVVTQFAVSISLIICTVIIYQQVQHIKARDLGYEKQRLVYTDMPAGMAEHFNAMRDDLLTSGAVEDAAISASPALQMWMTATSNQLTWEGNDLQIKRKINVESFSPEYLHTMGLTLTAGRNFHTDVRSDSGNVLINETMAKVMGKAGRIGAVLSSGRYSYHVIGIIKDFLFNDLYAPVVPLMVSYDPETSANYGFLTIRLRAGGGLADNLARVEAVIKKHNPGYPVDLLFVDQQFNDRFQLETRTGKLAALFSLLAISISCLGLFGLAAYTAERRTKEMGIRKVLGASVVSLAAMLSNEFLRLVALSCAIAFPLAWWGMRQWLQDFAYRTAIHWWVFGLAGGAALLIALLTVSFQAVRAALSNPVKTLKSE